MSDAPVTPAGLPRNREADAWRARAERAESRSCDLMAGMAVLVVAALALSSVCVGIASERDAARDQVAAAEQRAERAEAALRGGGALCIGDDVGVTPTPGPSWMQHSIPVPINLAGCQP